ncbi:DUF3810 family protein [Haliscomenobacter sp.]|uniref:DUF3810 family protein n=1 Tax=Haliscomenobacter sp. TaxID=2717303 RepID=UPI0033651149
MRNLKWNLFWIIAGGFALSLKFFLGNESKLVEDWYSRGLFIGVRYTFELLSWMPIPLMYLFWLMVLWGAWKKIQSWRKDGFAIGQFLLGTASFLGALLFFFFTLWGFNYSRVPIERQLGLRLKPLNKVELDSAFQRETLLLICLRAKIPHAQNRALGRTDFPKKLERSLSESLESWLSDQHFPTPGRVRGRLLYPEGVFLRFSTAGLYFPYTGEGHIDPGLAPLQWPYTLSHELGHGYGFADEGTCNFLALMGCDRSRDLAIRYSGRLNYWRTLAGQLRRYDSEAFQKMRDKLPKEIQLDLEAINTAFLRFPDFVPDLQPRIYNAYLKSQGIAEGVLNYDRVVMLAEAYAERTNE